MASGRHVRYEPLTKLSATDCEALQRLGRIKLTRSQCLSVETVLKEFEYLSSLRTRGEGKKLKEALRGLEVATAAFIKNAKGVQNEPGDIWGSLLGNADAEIIGLDTFLDECKKLNRAVGRRGAPKAHFLENLLSRLERIFVEATGVRATVSTGGGGRGGRFLEFAWAAMGYLPKEFRPHSKDALGLRFKRMQKAGGVRPYNWVGGPHPNSAKPWFQKSTYGRTQKQGS